MSDPYRTAAKRKPPPSPRDYKLHLQTTPAPLLSIFGGKITTYRRLAEHALELLTPHLQPTTPWTATAPLPGGGIPDFQHFLTAAAAQYPFLPPQTLRRMAHAYGTRLHEATAGATTLEALGEHFGGGLHEAELNHLITSEWARTAEDILWRRSKLGLRLTPTQIARIATWLEQHHA